jgi:plastocyanin
VRAALFLVHAFVGLAGVASAASVDIIVKDAKGAALADAVVWAMPKGKAAPPVGKREASIEQKDKHFIPYVTVVQTGSYIRFPNHDVVRHHVYSFSPPKPFELKLYVGEPTAPVLFDKPGEVVLGCNIHDDMLAFVYIVDTPWFAKTGADGTARIEGVPAGDYDLMMWHYSLDGPAAAQALTLRGDEAAKAAFTATTKAFTPHPGTK